MTSTEVQPLDSGNDDQDRTAAQMPHADRCEQSRRPATDWPPLTPAQLVRLATLLRRA